MSVNEKPISSPENGLFFNEKYIPQELLLKIFIYCDHKTLLSCQSVCKYWHLLIKDFIWHKKAEQSIGHALPVKVIPWLDYYFICDKKPFYKNLINNHSGESGNTDHWNIIAMGEKGWVVESPPGPLLPKDPIFNDNNSCFVTLLSESAKYQEIDLIKEGLSEYVLDNLQPTIKISEWFCCRENCLYECGIALLKSDKKSDKNSNLLKETTFKKSLNNPYRDQWFQYTYKFENYGPGLRRIVFIHGGINYHDDHHGAKMAGACIKLELSKNITTMDSTNVKSTEKILLFKDLPPNYPYNSFLYDWSLLPE